MQFHPTHYNGCNYLSILGLNSNQVIKSGQGQRGPSDLHNLCNHSYTLELLPFLT